MHVEFRATITKREAQRGMLALIDRPLLFVHRLAIAVCITLFAFGTLTACRLWLDFEAFHRDVSAAFLILVLPASWWLSGGLGALGALILGTSGNTLTYSFPEHLSPTAKTTFGEETDFVLSSEGITMHSSVEATYSWQQFGNKEVLEGKEHFVLAVDKEPLKPDGTCGFSFIMPVIVIPKRCLTEQQQEEFGSFLLEIGKLALPRPPRRSPSAPQ